MIKKTILSFHVIIILLSACGKLAAPPPTSTPTATQLPTLTPTPSMTPTPTVTPTSTITPTPFVATFDDDLCEIKESFWIVGELRITGYSMFGGYAISKYVESSPSYALYLYGYSKDFNGHVLQLWIKHDPSPGPNEMETLPHNFRPKDIRIYTSDGSVLRTNFATFDDVRVKLHVISLQETKSGDDPLSDCNFVVEEIQDR